MSTQENKKLNEEEIHSFIDKEIAPKIKSTAEGEIGVQNIWINIFVEWIKPLALEAIGKALEYLLDKGVEWAIDGANYALNVLQGFLHEKYLNSEASQREIFKQKILEKFPNSELAKKLSE